MNLQIRGDNVLVEVVGDPSDRLDAGDAPTPIVIPEAFRRFSRRGRVLAAGPGRPNRKGRHIPTELEPGQVVALPLKGGEVLSIGGVEHRILREREILAVIE